MRPWNSKIVLTFMVLVLFLDVFMAASGFLTGELIKAFFFTFCVGAVGYSMVSVTKSYHRIEAIERKAIEATPEEAGKELDKWLADESKGKPWFTHQSVVDQLPVTVKAEFQPPPPTFTKHEKIKPYTVEFDPGDRHWRVEDNRLVPVETDSSFFDGKEWVKKGTLSRGGMTTESETINVVDGEGTVLRSYQIPYLEPMTLAGDQDLNGDTPFKLPDIMRPAEEREYGNRSRAYNDQKKPRTFVPGSYRSQKSFREKLKEAEQRDAIAASVRLTENLRAERRRHEAELEDRARAGMAEAKSVGGAIKDLRGRLKEHKAELERLQKYGKVEPVNNCPVCTADLCTVLSHRESARRESYKINGRYVDHWSPTCSCGCEGALAKSKHKQWDDEDSDW